MTEPPVGRPPGGVREVVTEGVRFAGALAVAAAAFVALAAWRVPAWAVVIVAGLVGLVVLWRPLTAQGCRRTLIARRSCIAA